MSKISWKFFKEIADEQGEQDWKWLKYSQSQFRFEGVISVERGSSVSLTMAI